LHFLTYRQGLPAVSWDFADPAEAGKAIYQTFLNDAEGQNEQKKKRKDWSGRITKSEWKSEPEPIWMT